MSIDIKAIYQTVDEGADDQLSLVLDQCQEVLSQDQKDDLLEYCILQRRPSSAQEVLLIGANPSAVRGNPARPLLSSAIDNGQMEEAVLLVVMGADVDAPDLDGNTPAHFAARHNAPAVLGLLSRNGASLGLANKLGQSPMDLMPSAANPEPKVHQDPQEDSVHSLPRHRVSI